MKNVLCIYFLITSLHSICAQPYLNYTSTWTESSASCGFFGTCSLLDFTRTLAGDTVINGNTYFKVYTAGTLSTYDLNLEEITAVEPYIGQMQYIREDQKRFLRYHSSINDDVVLADFNLIIGDTLDYTNCGSPVVVHHIDTVYLNNEPRQRFYFSPGNASWANKTLIEGVGSSAGLFTHPCHEVGIESGSTMDCFSQDDGLIVMDTASSCNTTSAIELSPLLQKSIHVFPNPAGDYVDVKLDNEAWQTLARISVYNLQGQLLQSQIITSPGIDQRIELKGMAPGMYLLHISNGYEYDVIKFMKD